MKKLYVLICALAVGFCAFAQQGQKAVGLNLSYTPCLEKYSDVNNFGVAAKFQYGFTDNLRGELAAGYDFKSKGVGLFNAALNLHYLINVSEKFKIYPIAGVGYARFTFDDDYLIIIDDEDLDYDWIDYDDEDYDDGFSKNKVLVNAGLGGEYAVSERLSLCAEVKYQYIKDFSRLPISIGFSYKF